MHTSSPTHPGLSRCAAATRATLAAGWRPHLPNRLPNLQPGLQPTLQEVADPGPAATAAHALARLLARLAHALERRSRLWALRRTQRRSAEALGALDDLSLRDLGFVRAEISSVAHEAAQRLESARARVPAQAADGRLVSRV